MSTPIPTLRDLFADQGNGHRDRRPLPPAPPALRPMLGSFRWDGMYENAFELLDISVLDVMLRAWKTCRDVRTQVQASAADPVTPIVVELGAHRIRSEHRPSIEVKSNGRLITTLAFSVEVGFEITAAQLTLRGGAVQQIRTRDVKAAGVVKLEDVVILDRELTPVHLPTSAF